MNRLIVLISFMALMGCRCETKSHFDLSKIPSPVVFAGDSVTAYRGPSVLFYDNKIHLFFTVSKIIGDSIYLYTAQSESSDLINWTLPRRITPNDNLKSFSGGGNVVRFNDEWLMCIHSYPRPGYCVQKMPGFADSTARIYLMRSHDLETWSEPELIKVKGDIPEKDMGRMLDPYFVQDKDDPAKWWCFYRQGGVGISYTYDFKKWIPFGWVRGIDNVCVLTENNEYILFNSPKNGISIKKSRSLQNWVNWGEIITLGQEDWPWAKGRISAAAIANLKDVKGIESYLMFFHGSGPLKESEGDLDKNGSIGIAWSKDLVNWSYPQ